MSGLEKKIKNRLMRDIRVIKQSPVQGIHLEFDPENMFMWYFIIEGSEGTPFENGFYFGKIVLSNNYPYSPPTVSMITPNGRFEPNKSICFSYTKFHPELWSPSLNPSHVALGLMSFMNDFKDRGVGCISSSESQMKQLALSSIEFNLNEPIVASLFPDVMTVMKDQQLKQKN